MSQQSQTHHNAHNTHELFFREITRRKLNELLNRADVSTKILENHINERLPPHIRSNTHVGMNNTTKLCSVYIYFKSHDNFQQFGHISLHLHPKYLVDKYKRNSTAGRFHIKNNIRKIYYTLRVNKNTSSGKIILSIPQQQFTNPELNFASTITTQLLNDYLSPSSELFLGNKLTSDNIGEHACARIICNQISNLRSRIRLSQTMKRSMK
jgi:hypothetical protein